MKFTLSWLKDHLDTRASASEIVDALTRIGLEVEGVENPAEKLGAFRIARVLTAQRHPQADKLQVLSVDAGDGPIQVVCGAPNARAGLVGVFGPPGAYVPGSGITLKVAAIRGVESQGMMCSTRELELGDEHDGIIELPADAPIGDAYVIWAGLDDPVIDIAVTPNRQDCMGVRGIARDLAAAGLGTLKPLNPPRHGEGDHAQHGGGAGGAADGAYPPLRSGPLHHRAAPGGPPPRAGEELEIHTNDSEGCPAFYGRVIRNVRNHASPDWMQQRLQAVGQRPISAIVDITNYVMLDHGRPSHAYDLAKLSGPVVARRARAGETALALNGKEYHLTPEMTVIADDNGVHDIAGIMGGEHSGVSDATTDILLEVAYFTPERIAKTGQALSLTSDARARFERGVDPAFLDDAVEILTSMILDICGGEASAVIRAGQPPLERRVIDYDPEMCLRLGGLDVPAEQQRDILNRLGFNVSSIPSEVEGRPELRVGDQAVRASTSLSMDGWGKATSLSVIIPTWRRDIDGPADLVEEVVRIAGIDNVPSTPLPRADGVARPTATAEQLVERRVRRTAAARGLNEAITWSFISEKDAAALGGGAWALANPISEDMKVMRPSLLAGLLGAAQRNADRGAKSVRLFEVGRRYLADAERPTIGFVLAGERAARDWQAGKAQVFAAFDAKAEALALLEAAGAPVDNLQVMGDASSAYHPGQSATLRLGPKTVLAEFGAIHPALAKAFGVDGAVVAGEIFFDAIPAKRGNGRIRPAYTPPALQPVTRDFAFLAPEALPAADLVRAVRGADKTAILSAQLFDLFNGTGVPQGSKSLAVEVTLQPAEKSFTEQDLSAISTKIVAAAAKLGATLRG